MATEKSLPVKLKKLGLAFDFHAFTQLEVEHGINVMDQKKLKELELTPIVIRKLVWAGLLHKKPDVTLEEAGKAVGPMSNLVAVTQEIQEALVKAFTA